jgi:DNA recombination protein RmuC
MKVPPVSENRGDFFFYHIYCYMEILYFIVGLLLGVAITYWLLKQQTPPPASHTDEAYQKALAAYQEQASRLSASLKESFDALSRKALSQNTEDFLQLAELVLSKKTNAGEKALEGKKNLIDEALERMRIDLARTQQLVSRFEQERAQQYGQLMQQLQTASSQTAQLYQSTQQLKQVLGHTQARGQWGERMAEDVLRLIGLQEGVNYVKQQVLPGGRRPDFTFLMPKGMQMNMDVKFPLDNYLKYFEATAPDEKLRWKDAFMKDVRQRIKEAVGRGYTDGNNTLDHTLVFIPNEGIYSFILSEDPRLIDEALSQKAILCSPFTLYAILSVMRQAVEFFHLETQAQEMLEAMSQFKEEWERYAQAMDKLGKKLEEAQKEFQAVQGTRKRQLDKSLERVQLLREGRKQLNIGD